MRTVAKESMRAQNGDEKRRGEEMKEQEERNEIGEKERNGSDGGRKSFVNSRNGEKERKGKEMKGKGKREERGEKKRDGSERTRTRKSTMCKRLISRSSSSEENESEEKDAHPVRQPSGEEETDDKQEMERTQEEETDIGKPVEKRKDTRVRGRGVTSQRGRPALRLDQYPRCAFPATEECLCESLFEKYRWIEGETEKERQKKAVLLVAFLDRKLFKERARSHFKNSSYKNCVRLNDLKDWGATWENLSAGTFLQYVRKGTRILRKQKKTHLNYTLKVHIKLGVQFEKDHFPSDLRTFHVYLLVLIHELCHVVFNPYISPDIAYGFEIQEDGTEIPCVPRMHEPGWKKLYKRCSSAITNGNVCNMFLPWMIKEYGSQPYKKAAPGEKCSRNDVL